MNAIELLIAKQEIYEILITYCRGVDRLDEDLVRWIYHPDGIDDRGYWRGMGWDFAPFVVNRLREANSCTTHSVTNVLIEVDGDIATSEAQIQATLVRRGTDPVVADIMGARYVDRFSKRDGQWKIDERTVVLDWHKVETWPAAEAPIAVDRFVHGVRDQTDPVYIMKKHRTLR